MNDAPRPQAAKSCCDLAEDVSPPIQAQPLGSMLIRILALWGSLNCVLQNHLSTLKALSLDKLSVAASTAAGSGRLGKASSLGL